MANNTQPIHTIPERAANRYPFVSAFTACDVFEMVLVENAFLYIAGGDGYYYRTNLSKLPITHFVRDDGAAWRASVEGKKIATGEIELVENLA